jgi:hypothetical protein
MEVERQFAGVLAGLATGSNAQEINALRKNEFRSVQRQPMKTLGGVTNGLPTLIRDRMFLSWNLPSSPEIIS